MNKDLQIIIDMIEGSENINDEEKIKLIKTAKLADNELTIISFKLDRTEKVKRTTSILLEETIEELEQKRKAVEKQNSELEIEAALERVRARAMSMHKSNDLTSAVSSVFSELDKLGFKTIRCGIGIFNDFTKKKTVNVWTASSNCDNEIAHLSGDKNLEGHPLLDKMYDYWVNKNELSYTLKGKDLEKYYSIVSESNFPEKAPEVLN